MATASVSTASRQNPPSIVPKKKSVRLTLWPLVAATFFMVSGGTYGTEDIVHGAGYWRAIRNSAADSGYLESSTAFMIGELSSALPSEGGYYAWVRRAMGNFWGFQEAWLSLVASIFDMAIYPDPIRPLSNPYVSLVCRRTSRRDGGSCRGHRLCSA